MLPIDGVQWFSVAAGGDIVRTFWKAVTSVITISTEFLLFLKP